MKVMDGGEETLLNAVKQCEMNVQSGLLDMNESIPNH